MTRIAETLKVARSNLYERATGNGSPRGPYVKAGDEVLLVVIRRFVAERPSYGYRRITACVNRERLACGRSPINQKVVEILFRNFKKVLIAVFGLLKNNTFSGDHDWAPIHTFVALHTRLARALAAGRAEFFVIAMPHRRGTNVLSIRCAYAPGLETRRRRESGRPFRTGARND